MPSVRALPAVNPRYDVLSHVGRGGMGSVYRGTDTQNGEVVAIKVMRDDLNEEGADRFKREARTLSTLQHPAIVRYIDFGTTESGLPYLVMEWLEGLGLDAVLANESLSIFDALSVAQRTASALAAVHAAGVIHRDLKPSNILLVDGKPGRAKLIDFGLVRGLDATLVTQSGMALGTPGYMSPEQIRGTSEVDGRSDLYALGTVMFEMLTGRKPFQSRETAALVTRPLFEDAPRVSSRVAEVPAPLDNLVASLLAREPGDRLGSADLVQNILTEVMFDLPLDGLVRPHLEPMVGQSERRNVPVVVFRVPQPSATPIAVMGLSRTRRSGVTDLDTTFDDSSMHGIQLHLLDRLRTIVAPMGGQIRHLTDLRVAITVRATGTALDQATRALRCALAIRKHLNIGSLAIAMMRRDVTLATGALDGDEPYTAAARLLDGVEDAGVIRLDEVTGLLLANRIPVHQDAAGHWLEPDSSHDGELTEQTDHTLPCVGRDRELATLEGLWSECAEDERVRVALVTGPAGIGKSRLIREFLLRLDARGVPAQVWFSPTDELGAGMPFGVVQRALARAAGARGLTAAEARPRWRSWLATLVPSAELDALTDAMTALTDTTAAGEGLVSGALQSTQATARIDQTQRAVERVLALACESGPLLLILEDLHWADAASIRLLDHAFRALAELPLMVIGLSRPELFDVFPRLWQQNAPQHLALPGLAPKAATRLIKAALGDRVGDATSERLVAHAGGNAFYLEELIRAVRDGRGDAIPPTVLATVESRLLALDPEARRLLRAASVLGQSFAQDGLVALLGGADRDIDERAWLDHLVRTDFLRVEERAGRYRFAHALVHEAAYAMLTDADRARAHALAGMYLRDTGLRDPQRIARHFTLGGDVAEAARFLAQAARQALLLGDKEAARLHAEQAIHDGGDAPFVGEAHFVAAEACRQLGRNEEARAHTVAAVARLPTGSPLWYAAQRTVVMVGMSSFYGKR